MRGKLEEIACGEKRHRKLEKLLQIRELYRVRNAEIALKQRRRKQSETASQWTGGEGPRVAPREKGRPVAGAGSKNDRSPA